MKESKEKMRYEEVNFKKAYKIVGSWRGLECGWEQFV